MEILKIVAIAICGVILAMILKNAKSEIWILISLAVSIIIIFYIAAKMSGIISQIYLLKSFVSIKSEYIGVLIKVIGITYVTQLAADICRDNGFTAIAGQIEVFCKITIAAISIPIVISLFETVAKCVG
jgi:stage III sporulation protein AD